VGAIDIFECGITGGSGSLRRLNGLSGTCSGAKSTMAVNWAAAGPWTAGTTSFAPASSNPTVAIARPVWMGKCLIS